MLRLSEALADAVVARHKRRKKRVRRITIDLDPTVDPTHGGQQLTFFNGFYDTSCYLPLAGFLTFDDEVEFVLGVKDPYPEDTLEYRNLLPYDIVLITSLDHPLDGRETVSPEDVMFEADVYLLTRGLAERLKAPPAPEPEPPLGPGPGSDGSGEGPPTPGPGPHLPPGPEPPTPPEPPTRKTLRIHGDIPPEVWNRVGTRLLTKLRTGGDLKVGVTFELTASGPAAEALLADLRQILDDLQLTERVQMDVDERIADD